MRPRLLGFMLCLLGSGFAQAPASALVKGDPVLGERLVEGVATKDRLWLRNQAGAVVVFDRTTGARKVVASSGVRDLLRVGGSTAALQEVDGTPDTFVVTDLVTGKRLTPPGSGSANGLLRVGSDWVVVAADAVMRSDGGAWRRQAYRRPEQTFGVTSMEALADGTIYLGFNRGEWGGGLWRLSPGSPDLVEVRRVDGDEPCHGPLAAACDPVTGIVRDAGDSGCIFASIGLSHMMSHGRIMRVCGDKIDVVFSQKVEAEPGSFAAFAKMTLPMFGLVPSPGGWTAVTPGQLFISKHGVVTAVRTPALKPWAGLKVAKMDGVILTPTDVNWGMSLSGYTPLMIPVTE